MKISFVKMHGLGNDFVVLDDIAQPLPEDYDFARAAANLCDRKFGIGGDGLLLLTNSEVAELSMRMWNPDGTEDMCGNGLRCVVALSHKRGYAGENFAVQTPVGVRRASILKDNLVRVEMGKPSFNLSEIPFAPPENVLHAAQPIEYELPVGDVVLPHVTSLSTGSTHTVIFGPHPDEATFQKLSPLIENHAWFPERTSIMWAKITDENEISIRIWERGAGETLACGTGACATAVAAQMTGRAQTPLRVRSKGGTLIIELDEENDIWKTGPAQIVFEGSINHF